VYDCDAAAKRIMAQSADVRDALIDLVGTHLYADGVLQKAVMAQFILESEQNKRAVNAIVHPAVAADFMSSGREWLESALLFDSHFDRLVSIDHVVCVAAPMEVRLKRIAERDHITPQQARQWIDRQMTQEEMMAKSDFIITNDGAADLTKQIETLINNIYNNTEKNGNNSLSRR